MSVAVQEGVSSLRSLHFRTVQASPSVPRVTGKCALEDDTEKEGIGLSPLGLLKSAKGKEKECKEIYEGGSGPTFARASVGAFWDEDKLKS